MSPNLLNTSPNAPRKALAPASSPAAVRAVEALRPASGAGPAFSDDPFARMLEQNRQTARLQARREAERQTENRASNQTVSQTDSGRSAEAAAAEPAAQPAPAAAAQRAPGSAAAAPGDEGAAADAGNDRPGAPDRGVLADRQAAARKAAPDARAAAARTAAARPSASSAGTAGTAEAGDPTDSSTDAGRPLVRGQPRGGVDSIEDAGARHAADSAHASPATSRPGGRPSASRSTLSGSGPASSTSTAALAATDASAWPGLEGSGYPAGSIVGTNAGANPGAHVGTDAGTQDTRNVSKGASHNADINAELSAHISTDISADPTGSTLTAAGAAGSTDAGSAGTAMRGFDCQFDPFGPVLGLPVDSLPPSVPPPAAPPVTPPQHMLPAHPGSEAFGLQLGAQVTLWLKEGVQEAQLQLNPADMGPVKVAIVLDGAAAQVSFSAEHALTRQALEQALPTLAGTLAEAGFTLAGGGVFDQAPTPQRQADDAPGGRARAGATASNTGAADPSLARTMGRPRGVVDLIA